MMNDLTQGNAGFVLNAPLFKARIGNTIMFYNIVKYTILNLCSTSMFLYTKF